MSSVSELTNQVARLTQLVEKHAKPQSRGGIPSEVFGGGPGSFKSYDPRRGDRWDTERLERLSKAYNHENAARMLLASNGGKPRALGWGSHLRKMAALCCKNLGISLPEGANNEWLERETGFVSIEKAATHGIKGPTGQVRKTALAEGSGLTGGYVVPPQFLNELQTIAAEDSFIEPRAKVIPMTSRTMTIPMLDITTVQSSGTSPYFGGILATWQPEAQSINESEPQFKQSEWVAWDLELYAVSSNQLLADNGIGLDALLTQLFAQALTWYKEYAFLRGLGAGSSMPLGIINAPATIVQSRTTPNKFLLSDAAAMMAHLQVRSWDSACWIMHQSALPQLIQMTDNSAGSGAGRLEWVNPVMPGNVGPLASKLPNAFLNGLPIFFTEKLPALGTKGDVMLVDWSQYIIGNRMDLQIAVSDQYLFRTNQLAWRVIARCDGRPWLNSYITDASGWTVSPFVVLAT